MEWPNVERTELEEVVMVHEVQQRFCTLNSIPSPPYTVVSQPSVLADFMADLKATLGRREHESIPKPGFVSFQQEPLLESSVSSPDVISDNAPRGKMTLSEANTLLAFQAQTFGRGHTDRKPEPCLPPARVHKRGGGIPIDPLRQHHHARKSLPIETRHDEENEVDWKMSLSDPRSAKKTVVRSATLPKCLNSNNASAAVSARTSNDVIHKGSKDQQSKVVHRKRYNVDGAYRRFPQDKGITEDEYGSTVEKRVNSHKTEVRLPSDALERATDPNHVATAASLLSSSQSSTLISR